MTRSISKLWANRIGFVGVALFVAVIIELGTPRLRVAMAHILPIQVLVTLLCASALCVVASIRGSRWFWLPCIVVFLFFVLLIISSVIE
jgi:hypothetical protein